MDIKLAVTSEIGDAKKTVKMELTSASEVERMTLLAGLFEVLDIKLPDMIGAYEQIGKAYSAYLKAMNAPEPEEPRIPDVVYKYSNELGKVEPNAIQSAYAEAFEKKKQQEEPQEPQGKQEDGHDYYATGYKIINGIKFYKCRINCSACGEKSNRYIKVGTKTVTCNCGKVYDTYPAKPGTHLLPDEWKNFYKAGDL